MSEYQGTRLMNVSELIKLLQQESPDAIVCISDGDAGWTAIRVTRETTQQPWGPTVVIS